MSEISRPWQSTSPGDAGPYSAANWQQLYQYIIGLGSSRINVGPLFGSGTQPNTALNVQAKGTPDTTIDVLPGSALVQGVAYINTGTVSFTIAANASGNARIDTVVLQADYALQTVRLAVLQGTPAASPSAPSLTQSANVLWEIPLADIAVANGFTSITNANITPRHEWANAANGIYLDNVLNNSGGELNTGDVVIWDTTANRAVTTTTTFNHIYPAGVWVGRTANGSYGRLLVHGIGYIKTNAALARGVGLVTSTTVKQAAAVTTGLNIVGNLGFMLEASVSNTLALAYIDAQRAPAQVAVFINEVAQNTGGQAFTTGAERLINVNTEVSDPYGIASVAANQITLAAGRYRFLGQITVQAVVGADRKGWLLLHNTTAGARILKSDNIGVLAAAYDMPTLQGEFEILVQSVLEFRVLLATTGWNNFVLNVAGETERYTYMEFERLP